MPVTRSCSQRTIDFPVRKSSVSRKKPVQVRHNVLIDVGNTSPTKRKALTDAEESLPGSPPKIGKGSPKTRTDKENIKSATPSKSPAEKCSVSVLTPTKHLSPSKCNILKVVQPVIGDKSAIVKQVFGDSTNSAKKTSRVALRFDDEKGSPKKQQEKPLVHQSPIKSVTWSDIKSPVKSHRITTLSSPVKSRDVTIVSSPRKLLNSPLKLQPDVRMSPRKVASPFSMARQQGLCYHRARQALHTALPDRLMCRETELNEVSKFITSHVTDCAGASLYISGAPGTGKTAVLSHVLKQLQSTRSTPMIYINCMSVRNSQAIYNSVLGEMTGKSAPTSLQAAARIQKTVTTSQQSIVLVMDEIDTLETKNQEVLYTMFEWPHIEKSKLILIGIANALDLTDRILPRLQAQPKCKPKVINFSPYTKDQIVTVIQDRLSRVSVGGESVLEPAAVVFVARKVSAVAGDMRKALDVCRRAVEAVEKNVAKQTVSGSENKVETKPAVPRKIGVGEILRVINEIYGSGVSVTNVGRSGQEGALPLQQKITICSLLLSLKQGAAKKGVKEVNLGKLHENYSRICRAQEVSPVDQAEFVSLCALIEARGIVTVKKSKDARSAKITLKLDEQELEQTLKDKVLVSTILRNGIPSR